MVALYEHCCQILPLLHNTNVNNKLELRNLSLKFGFDPKNAQDIEKVRKLLSVAASVCTGGVTSVLHFCVLPISRLPRCAILFFVTRSLHSPPRSSLIESACKCGTNITHTPTTCHIFFCRYMLLLKELRKYAKFTEISLIEIVIDHLSEVVTELNRVIQEAQQQQQQQQEH